MTMNVQRGATGVVITNQAVRSGIENEGVEAKEMGLNPDHPFSGVDLKNTEPTVINKAINAQSLYSASKYGQCHAAIYKGYRYVTREVFSLCVRLCVHVCVCFYVCMCAFTI